MKLAQILVLLLLVLVQSSLALAAPPSAAKILTLQKLEDLDSAANLLLAIADERIAAKKICHLDSATAANMMNPLHSRVDEQTAVYLREQKKAKVDLSSDNWLKDCDKNCHCGLYASILEAVGFEKLNAHDKKNYRTLSHLAVNSTKPAQTACAKKAAASGLDKCVLFNDLKAAAPGSP
jgi:hypothetical protein